MSLTKVACCTQHELKPDSPTCYTEYMPEHLQNYSRIIPNHSHEPANDVFKQIH